jgi:ribosomal protein S18 acetylase RimI-like enzyme
VTAFLSYEIRELRSDETAALFVVHAAIESVDAGQLLAWTQEMEERLETGGRGWVAARGRRLAGYAVVDPVPGLPGVHDLSGGIMPARRRQGLGTHLLRHVQDAAGKAGIDELSCRVDSLEDDSARFLLGRGFRVEHEECLLELSDLSRLPTRPADPPAELITLPQSEAVGEFCRIYKGGFDGTPWSQPYAEAEVAAALIRPEDLLFLVVDGAPVGVVWHELLPGGRGRVEPIGILRDYQGRGYGRRLLLAALHNLRQRDAQIVEIGVWRNNQVAMNLYRSLGFLETDNWYFLSCEVGPPEAGLKAE